MDHLGQAAAFGWDTCHDGKDAQHLWFVAKQFNKDNLDRRQNQGAHARQQGCQQRAAVVDGRGHSDDRLSSNINMAIWNALDMSPTCLFSTATPQVAHVEQTVIN